MSASINNTAHGPSGGYGRVIVHADLDCFYCQVSNGRGFELVSCFEVAFRSYVCLCINTSGEIGRMLEVGVAVAAGCSDCSVDHGILGRPQVSWLASMSTARGAPPSINSFRVLLYKY